MFDLTRYETTAEDAANARHSWAVRLVATNTDGQTPASIFVVRKAADGEFDRDDFSCVASAIQMYDLAVDTPTEDSPFFRKDDVTVLLRNADAAEEFYAKVVAAVQALADNLIAATNLSVTDTVTIEPNPNVIIL